MKLSFSRKFKKTRYDKYIIGFLILTFLYGVIGFFVIPPIAKNALISRISKALNRPVSIEKIKINPFALSIDVINFRIIDKDGMDFMSFDGITVNFEIISAFKRALVLKEFTIGNPFVRIELDKNGNYNFSDIIKNLQESPKQETGKRSVSTETVVSTPENTVSTKESSATKSEKQPPKSGFPLNVIVKKLNINGGKIIYADKSLGQTFFTDLR